MFAAIDDIFSISPKTGNFKSGQRRSQCSDNCDSHHVIFEVIVTNEKGTVQQKKPNLSPEDLEERVVEPTMKRSMGQLLFLVVSLIVSGAWFWIVFAIAAYLDGLAGQGAGVHSPLPYLGLIFGLLSGCYIFYKTFMWLVSFFELL